MTDVIIPTYKTQAEIHYQMESMRPSTPGHCVRITGTCQQGSAAHNRNYGLTRATSDVVIMVDDDVCRFPVIWANHLEGVLRSNPRCAMVSARLLNEDGTPGPMLREPPPTVNTGLTVAKSLLTACVAFHNDGLRFDENFVGSGWEDDDFCAQLRGRYPGSLFLIDEDVRVVHKNNMTNQGFIKGVGPVPGGNFEKNRAYYESKWGKRP